MKVTDVEVYPISIPLDSPVSFATKTIEERDHAIVYVRTDEGHEGLGYSLGYGGASLVAEAVSDLLAPIILGEDPRDTERLWRKMFDGTVQIGRKGVMIRAISCVDIALWDVKGKAAGMSLAKLLGGGTEPIPAYASGGYYREEKGLSGLREEMETSVERGHDTVKMKVGRLPLKEEVERVRVAREAIGPNRRLLMDANGKWKHKQEAVRACRAFGEYDPYFIEEPVMPDSVDLMREVNAAINYPVVSGELEFSRYGFAELLRENAIEIVQPDVTVVGGVTEFMRVAHTAASYDIPVAPHYNWDLHVQLLAALENGLFAEYFYRDSDVKSFDDVVENPLVPENGALTVPDRPGHGVTLDRNALDEFRI
jgi:L-alanine-DL-glutamate epimerase and related enzymes of enolase superfamily